MDHLDRDTDKLVELITAFELQYGSSLTLHILEVVAQEINLTIGENEND